MPPLTVMVKPVSGLCNMRCAYCFYADELARRSAPAPRLMEEPVLDSLMRRVFAYADGRVTLIFQGGEPTLAGADFYRRVLALERYYNGRRLPVGHALQTNGLALDDDMIAVLMEGRFLVGVSLDGTPALHDSRRPDAQGRGTWERVCENLRRLRRAGVPCNVLCVVDAAVAAHPTEVFERLAPYGHVQFLPCLDPLDQTHPAWSLSCEAYGRFLIETYRLYARALRAGRYVSVRAFDNWMDILLGHPPEACGALGRCAPQFVAESDGTVYPCDFYALDEWALGNVRETSLLRMARSPRMRAFCSRSDVRHPDCQSCRFAFLCGGGCMREREAGKSRYCEAHRLFFDACLVDMRALCAQLVKEETR